MIEQQKEKDHWEFLFLRANIDVEDAAGRMGIPKGRAANYHSDREGTNLNFKVLSNVISRVRDYTAPICYEKYFDDGVWKEEIDQDYTQRNSQR